MKEIKLTRNGDFVEMDIENPREIKIAEFMQTKNLKQKMNLNQDKEGKIRKTKLRNIIVKSYNAIGNLFIVLGVVAFSIALALYLGDSLYAILAQIIGMVFILIGGLMKEETKKYI